MQQNVNILRAQRPEQVVRPDALAPVSTRAALHPVRQPQRLVVVCGLAGRAATVVAVLVVEAATGRGALRDAFGVDRVGVDLNVRRVALEQRGVARGPPSDLHRDVGVGEVVVARRPGEPLGVLGRQRRADLVTLLFGHRASRVPTDAVVDGPMEWM